MPYRPPLAKPRPTRPSQLPPRPPPQRKPNPPRPIALTSPLLTYIWALHQQYREHNTHLTNLHSAKNAAFANALNVPRNERRPQPGDFRYSLYGPFGKHYGQIVKLHVWKGAEVYWGECMLRVWSLVKSQAWVAQLDEQRVGWDKERRLREEEERAWEAVDMLREMGKNLKEETDTRDGRDSVRGGAVEGLDWERKSESSNPTGGMEFGISVHTDTSASGPSGSGEAIAEQDADSSEEESPEPLPPWAQHFVDRAPTHIHNPNYSDLPSWAISVINSLPQEPPPSKTPSNIPLSLYSPFHQHHTTLVLDPTPVESAYPASHTLTLYHHVLTSHPTLSQEAHDCRTVPFLRGPTDVISTPLRNLRFNSFDFLFRAALRRHIGKARRGLDAVKEQEEEIKARRESVNEEEPEKWGRWNQWEEMVAEGDISPPGLGRFRGYMGQKLWRLKNPGKKYYSAPMTQQRWGKDRKGETEPGKLHKPGKARIPEGKENWVEEVLMGTTEPEPQVEAEQIDLAPELEKALDILFEKPRVKTHDAAPITTVAEDKSEAVVLPKVDEPVGVKRPIHEEFNEVARMGRGYLSMKWESKVSTITNGESHVEVKSAEETIKTTTAQSTERKGFSTSMIEHTLEENGVTGTSSKLEMDHKHMEHEHRAVDSNNTQDDRARESGAEWLNGVFQDVPATTSTSQRRRAGRNTLTSPPPFLATDVFPPQFPKTPSSPQPQPDSVSSATHPHSSPQSQSPSYSGPAEDFFQNWAVETGLFRSPADRAWAYVDHRTKPPAPRFDRETRWTVRLAEQMRSSGGQDESEDLTALQRELELVRRKISRIESNEWWKRNEGRQVGSVDFEAEPRTAPDGLWGEGRRNWRRRKKVKKE